MSVETPKRRWHPRKKAALAAVAVIVCVLIGMCVLVLVQAVTHVKQLPESYARDLTADALVRYVHANEGKWPSNWDDLEPYFRKGHQFVSFEEAKHMTRVDWDANPSELVNAESPLQNPPFPVVWLKSDEFKVPDDHANWHIWHNLRGHEFRQFEFRQSSVSN